MCAPRKALFSPRKHFLQNQALCWQHQIPSWFLSLSKLTLQETEARDKNLIQPQHGFFSSLVCLISSLDGWGKLSSSRPGLSFAQLSEKVVAAQTGQIPFSASGLSMFLPQIKYSFISCSFLTTSYSWCLLTMRLLTHCPQCTWKAKGQRS